MQVAQLGLIRGAGRQQHGTAEGCGGPARQRMHQMNDSRCQPAGCLEHREVRVPRTKLSIHLTPKAGQSQIQPIASLAWPFSLSGSAL